MEKQLQFGNNTISYYIHGNGQPVILLHGFGEKSSVWDSQVTALAPAYKMIIPELPGAGDSTPAEDVSMEALAEMVHAIVNVETGADEKIILLGHSMGGYVTLAFAEQYESRLRAFGLIHSACFADSDEKKETRRKGIRFITDNGAAAFLNTTSPNLFSPDTKEKSPELITSFLAGVSDLQDQQLIRFYEAMMQRPDRSNVLKETRLPVLFVLGRHDNAIPIKDGLKQTTFPELSYIHVLEHSGHMGMLEEKEHLNRILSDFLRAV